MPEELDECFERNAEGILKNMAIHELCILVSRLGVTAASVAANPGSVELDPEIEITFGSGDDRQTTKIGAGFTACETRTGPVDGEAFTDFSRLACAVTAPCGTRVAVVADRCGGTTSVSAVHALGKQEGEQLFCDWSPNEEEQRVVDEMQAKDADSKLCGPGASVHSYFYANDADYATIKAHCGAAGAGGLGDKVASLKDGIEALRLAETLTEILIEAKK